MKLVAILIGLGPLIGWGIYPTIASKFGGKPVNQILGSTIGTLIFAIVYNQIEHLGFPQGKDLLLAILSRNWMGSGASDHLLFIYVDRVFAGNAGYNCFSTFRSFALGRRCAW